MTGHHLILGKLVDVISGKTIDDTHDEQYKQKIARLLITQKGFNREDIEKDVEVIARAGEKSAIVKVDFIIKIAEKKLMVIKYGPGSIVTRRRSALAASRVIAPYQIPIVVVTNGYDAEILDGTNGNVVANGLYSIPEKEELLKIEEKTRFAKIEAARSEMESRLLYVYEVDGACPCDDSVCRL